MSRPTWLKKGNARALVALVTAVELLDFLGEAAAAAGLRRRWGHRLRAPRTPPCRPSGGGPRPLRPASASWGVAGRGVASGAPCGPTSARTVGTGKALLQRAP